ncbi:hypothetical protein B0A49_08814 [Cryomyces minteri]|uniref:Uncharacterized protein n=1 Tax=Cryomyces minteri TaxID=331657 RepID=A0A4U0XA38_9PEZI|nr:hypothetical protein B0A49_08814 [Cryomyces minteri]
MGGHVTFSEAEAAAIFDALEQKRRQLDEQIHRYRAQKDKEYRLFERELRSKHRARKEGISNSTISGQEKATRGYFVPREDLPDTTKRLSNVDEEQRKPLQLSRADEDDDNPDDVGDDVSSAHDRERDFLGVFTQSFLPLLDDFRGTRSGTQSAPMLSPNISTKDDICKPKRGMLQRANTEPPAYGQPAKKAPLVSEVTQSTPPEQPKHLHSAMRSPSDRRKSPVAKRVSLAIDGEVVSPSDNVDETARSLKEPLPSQSCPIPIREETTRSQGPADTSADRQLSNLLEPAEAPVPSESAPPQPMTPQVPEPRETTIGVSPSSPSPSPPQQTPQRPQVDPLDEDFDFTFDDLSAPADPASCSTIEESSTNNKRARSPSPSPPSSAPAMLPSSFVLQHRQSSLPIASPGFRRPSAREYLPAAPDEEDLSGMTGGWNQVGSLGQSYMEENAKLMAARRRESLEKSGEVGGRKKG